MTKEKLDKIRKRLNAATPGPWEWDVNSACRIARLLTTHSGRYYVMEFSRWGTNSAAPEFQVYNKYEGDVRERGSHGMVRADKLLKSYPGKEHHVGYDDYIDHPDAELIANAYQDIRELLEYVDELKAFIADPPVPPPYDFVPEGDKTALEKNLEDDFMVIPPSNPDDDNIVNIIAELVKSGKPHNEIAAALTDLMEKRGESL